jgi:hypothetical protein
MKAWTPLRLVAADSSVEQLVLSMPTWDEPTRQCVGSCGLEWPLDWFPIKQAKLRGYAYPLRRRARLCKGCWQLRRDERKYVDRFWIKARTTRRDHAPRLSDHHGRLFTTTILERVYGWELDVMAADAEHAYGGDCSHCHIPYAAMPNGLASMTLDITDRDAEPVYGTNTSWMCETGNRQKNDLTMAQWNREVMLWRRWRQAMGHQIVWPPPVTPTERMAAGAQLVLGGTIWR